MRYESTNFFISLTPQWRRIYKGELQQPLIKELRPHVFHKTQAAKELIERRVITCHEVLPILDPNRYDLISQLPTGQYALRFKKISSEDFARELLLKMECALELEPLFIALQKNDQ